MRPARLASWIAAGLGGVLLGLASAWMAIARSSLTPVPGAPNWRFDSLTGSPDAGAYTRARVAYSGLLALKANEALYFQTDRDAAGHRLDAGCSYRIQGVALPARWWSVTLYDENQFLARNADAANSVDATGIVPDANGSWSARIAATRGDADKWLSTHSAGAFSLTLRLYQPDAKAIAAPETMTLPVIRRERCEDPKS